MWCASDTRLFTFALDVTVNVCCYYNLVVVVFVVVIAPVILMVILG